MATHTTLGNFSTDMREIAVIGFWESALQGLKKGLYFTEVALPPPCPPSFPLHTFN